MSIALSAKIHPSAIIEDGAVIGEQVEVGPFCVVGPEVSLAEGVRLISHVVIAGVTRVGPRTVFYPFASIGHAPQDLKYAGERVELVIGADNVFREHSTANPGTAGDNSITKIGDRCLFMMGSHIAHDCVVGDHVILANNATIAGHVHVGNGAILGGISAVHQFTRIGRNAMIGGMTGVEKDVIPFGSVMGNRAYLAGLNLIGMKRAKLPRETINATRAAYRMIFEGEEGSLQSRAQAAAEAFPEIDTVQEIAAFLSDDSARSFCTPRA